MKIFRHIICFFIVTLAASTAYSQTESELKEDANKLFEKEQYVDATSKYLHLLSLNPKSGDYNFRYGTCLLFNSYQKIDALRYLSFSVKQTAIDPRAFYFYGKALHLNYQFKDAIKNYKIYQAKRAKRDRRYNVGRQIQMCENGKKLLTTFTEIIVIDKKEIDQAKFYQLYDNIETVGGDILVSADFQSKIDKKKGHVPIVHFSPNAKAIYYSSYGDKGDSGKDIYIRRRLPSGKWGDPQLLPGMVNTMEDEDFPFMHSSGEFLFFSSKGHNSMGGYDIFMSHFDPNTNSFNKPENVDFAISSPDDDLFYIVDETFQNAYFASARQSQNGKLHVYNVRVERAPIRDVIVIGDFLSEINPENKAMTVNVTNYTNGEKVGLIKSNKAGKYSFVFPQGGKYNYEVNVDGSDNIYKFVVELPFLDEFRPLKQKAIHTSIDGQEIVRIINLFDDRVEGAEALIAEVIRKKATLDVNVNNFDLNEVDAQAKRNKILADLDFNDMSLREVSNQLEELAITEKLKQEKVELINLNIGAEIVEKSEQIQVLAQQLVGIKKKIEASSTPAQEYDLLNEALRIESERVQLATEINNLDILNNKVAATLTPGNGNGQILQLENQFNSLVSEEKDDEALLLLSKSKDAILKTKNESPDAIVNVLVKESVALSQSVKKLKNQELEYEKSMDQLSSKILLLKNQLPDAKKKEYKKIKSEIARKEEELELANEMQEISQKSVDKKNKELSVLDNNIASMQKAMLNDEIVDVNSTLITESVKEVKEILRDNQTEKYKQAILAIEESYPKLSPDYDANSEVNDPLLINQVEFIKNRNKEKAVEIALSSQLSKIERDEQLTTNNNSTIVEIEHRLDEVKSELSKNPKNLSLNEELISLNDLKSEITEENKVLKKAISDNKQTVETTEVALSQEDVLDEIISNYTEDVVSINSNSDYSEKEKLEALQNLDEKAVSNIVKEQSRLNKELRKDSNNQELVARNNILNDILEEKQADMNERSQTLNAMDNVSSIVDDSFVRKELENKIKGNLASEVERVEKGGDSDFEKNKQVLELNQSYLEDILKEKKESENELSKNSEVASLIQQVNVLKAMQTEQEEKLAQLKENAVTSINAEDLQTAIASVDKKYLSDIDEIKATNTLSKFDGLASREVELQKNIEGVIAEKEKALKRKYSVTVDLDKTIFERALSESKIREQEALTSNENAITDNNQTNTNSNQETKLSYIQELRQEFIAGDEDALFVNYSTKEELTKQDETLSNYETQLTEEIKFVEKEIKKDKTDQGLKENLDWLENELEIVQKKRRQISVSFGELETEIIADNSLIESDELQSPVEKLESSQEQNRALITQLEKVFTNNADPILLETKELSADKSSEIERFIKELDKANTKVEKEYLLIKAQEEQDAMNSILATALANKQREAIEESEGINLLTQEELQKRKRRFSIQIGDLTTEIITVDEEIKTAKRKEIPKLETRKSHLIAQRNILEKQLRKIEEQLLEEDAIVSVVSEDAVNATMTFNEERKQAGTDAYKKYYELGTDALVTEGAIVDLEKELKEEKTKVNQLINENSPAKKEEIVSSVKKIKGLTSDIEQLKTELTQKKYLADQALPINPTEAMRIQNLVYRGVKPLKTVAIATLLQMPVNGFAMNETPVSSYSEANPIPVDVESPSGLVYRVQIGAFAKPIPQSLYKEFTPVSGEKIEGTNITRYMAGYFNNSSAVVDARRSIRTLGYSDAFIVAYCDGKRIGFGDARRREANGTCVPKGTNELMVEVATNTAENLGLPVSQEVQEVPELTYNQAPGASYADPIEMMQGLFFTVQIGVYNRPVSNAVAHNLPELSTVRLANGQIRYNTGLFNSVAEALPRRKEALKRGVVGAFVVAYYQGERIPLAEAKLLLKENGESILQTNLPKILPDEPSIDKNSAVVERTDSVTVENITPAKNKEVTTTDRIQIVTKKIFDEFPRDVLNRYNAEGSFFFDAKDKRVKSVIYENEDDLPRLWNFVDDIDTVYIPFSEIQQFNRKTIIVDIEGATIPGDVMDWLLRFSYPREITETKTGIKLKIFEVEEEKEGEIMKQIRTFDLKPVIEEVELEIEEYE